jgi:tRNA pseudouridine38-40 synthase
LEEALARFTGEGIRIRGASRTDSGAHAEGQVVDFLTRTRRPLERFAPALNYFLPDDIRVLKARKVDERFDSRRSALSRTYRYHVLVREWPSPLRRGTHFWLRGPLDTEAMARAARSLTGVHDFRPLAAGHPEDRSAVRNVQRWEVFRNGESLTIECEANGFLKHQIRKANGILVEIGKGKQPESLVKRVLEGGETIAGIPMLSAHGLCLIEVKYPERIFADRTADQTNEEN